MSFLESYQTLIVGVVGFGGVMLTIWYNAHEARKQRDKKLAHDRTMLRIGFIEDLRIIRESLDYNAGETKDGAPKGAGGAFVPTSPLDGFFRSMLDRIGLLPREEVRTVMRAYLSIRTYSEKLFLIGVPTHTGPHHVKVPAENIKLLNLQTRGLFDPVDEAIAALETGLKQT